MRRRLTFGFIFAFFMALIPSPSQAQTNSTWNSTTGNWTDATRWSTNPIFPNNGQPNPGDTYNAIVNGGAVTMDQNIIIQSLTFSGGLIDGGSNLTLNAASTWSGGAMSGAGTTTFNGSLALTTSGIGSRSLVNNGATTWSGANNLIGSGSGTWSNQSGALFDIQNNQNWDNGGAVNNLAGATFRKSAGTGTSTIVGTFNNSGAVEVNTGTLSFTGGGASSGSATFAVASGATLNFGSGSNVLYTVAAGSSISGAGGVCLK
jgi:hypothetical protein